MSRFWGGDDSESGSESGSENEEAVAPTPQSAKPKASNRFLLADFDDDDDQPQQKRVVKSQKDRRYEDILASIATIKAATKTNEWSTIATEFDKLNRHVQKAATVIEKEGVPRFYTKALANLEDALKEALDSKIKMNPTNTKSLNAMKLKLKKHNKTYEKEIQEYRKNPDAGSDGEQDEEGKEDEKEPEEPKEVPKPAPKKEEKKEEKKPAPKELDGESESESEDESSEGERDAQPEVSQLKGKDKWLKKTAVDTKSDQAKKKQKKDKKKPTTRADGSTPQQKEKSGSKDTELDKEAIDKKLEEIISLRGKKGTDRNEQIQQLVVLSEKAKTPEQAVAVLMNLVSGMFDINPNINLHMSAENWKKTHTYMTKILVLLKENNVPLIEPDDEGEIQMAALETTEKKIVGSLIAFTERLGDELLKSLQFTDPHTEEYVKRLQDENLFLDVAKAALDHYAAHKKMHKAARVAVRLIEHLYYKTETKPEQATQLAKTLQELSALVYQHADDKHFAKIKTVLCNIYHLALYDKYFEARDLLLMSHLQDNIQHMDVSTQILSNRTMVQLGLCAFRKGLIQEAHSALSEICSSGKVKELLAQGITGRFSDKNPEQEKLEKRRQVPYHMQINLELLECVHLISAMLLEVPNMAANPYDSKRKVISRQFRRLLDYNERQVFNGPPENTRETVLAASRGLSKGDWKTCEALLLKLNIWNLVSNSETIKAMLRRKIQEEGLRTFLFTYSRHYSSLSLTHLTEMFELPVNVVHSLVSKMMINDELHASWDQPTSSILMHKVEPTRLQHLALQISEKAAFFVENNEKILDPRFGFKPYEGKGPQGGKGGAGGQGADRWQPPKSGGRYQGKGRNPAYSNN